MSTGVGIPSTMSLQSPVEVQDDPVENDTEEPADTEDGAVDQDQLDEYREALEGLGSFPVRGRGSVRCSSSSCHDGTSYAHLSVPRRIRWRSTRSP